MALLTIRQIRMKSDQVQLRIVHDHQAYTDNEGAVANLVLKIANPRFGVARQYIFNWKHFIYTYEVLSGGESSMK